MFKVAVAFIRLKKHVLKINKFSTRIVYYKTIQTENQHKTSYTSIHLELKAYQKPASR